MKKRVKVSDVEAVVALIGPAFRTFGGGRDSNMNPIAHALKDEPLQFAAGVDVRAVVLAVLNANRLLGRT